MAAADLDALLAEHTPAVAATARWLHGVILEAMPGATVKVWFGWHGVGYHHPRAGYVLGAFPKADTVDLYFEWGVLMPDPEGLLGGTHTKRTRTLTVAAPGSPAAETITEYVDLAVEAALDR